MKYRTTLAIFCLMGLLALGWLVANAWAARPAIELTATQPTSSTPSELENPAINMPGYLAVSAAAARHRETHRLSEAEFIEMSGEPGTIVLDARSAEKYAELHIKGAVNLSFPDITVENLKRFLPDQNSRILIYCNNNFAGAEGPFPSKLPTASLNISTYIALYDYGYRNVYELGPLLDLQSSKIEFAGISLDAHNPPDVATVTSTPDTKGDDAQMDSIDPLAKLPTAKPMDLCCSYYD